jgi:hypothetical protein
MKKCILFLSVVMLSACNSYKNDSEQEGAPDIKVKYGRMDDYTSLGSVKITATKKPIDYETNGMCRDASGDKECMRWGVKLEYAALKNNITLQCESEKTINSDPYNARSLFTPSVLRYKWEVELAKGSSVKTLAFYSLPGSGIETVKSQCTLPDSSPLTFATTIILSQ